MDIPLPGEPIAPSKIELPVAPVIDIPLPKPKCGQELPNIPFPPPSTPSVPIIVAPSNNDGSTQPTESSKNSTKLTVLGKLQAKKRLLAFSASKQVSSTATGLTKPAGATGLSFGFSKTSPVKVTSAYAFHDEDDDKKEGKKKRKKDSDLKEPSAMEEIKREEEKMREALFTRPKEKERRSSRHSRDRHRTPPPEKKMEIDSSHSEPPEGSEASATSEASLPPSDLDRSSDTAREDSRDGEKEERGRYRRASSSDRKEKRRSDERHNSGGSKERSDKQSLHTTAHPQDLPSSWVQMKQRGLNLEELRRLRKVSASTTPSSSETKSSSRRLSSRSRSRERRRHGSSKSSESNRRRSSRSSSRQRQSSSSRLSTSPEPKIRQPYIALSIREGEKEYPLNLVKYTKFRPSITFCENPCMVPGYYKSRDDYFKSESPVVVDIMKEILNSSTNTSEELNSSGLVALQVSYEGDDMSEEEVVSSPKKPERNWFVKDDQVSTLASLNLLGESSPSRPQSPSTIVIKETPVTEVKDSKTDLVRSKWDSDYESEHSQSKTRTDAEGIKVPAHQSKDKQMSIEYEEFMKNCETEELDTASVDNGVMEKTDKKSRKRKDEDSKKSHSEDKKKKSKEKHQKEEIPESNDEPPVKKKKVDKKKKKKSKKKVEHSSDEGEDEIESPKKSKHKKKSKSKHKKKRPKHVSSSEDSSSEEEEEQISVKKKSKKKKKQKKKSADSSESSEDEEEEEKEEEVSKSKRKKKRDSSVSDEEPKQKSKTSEESSSKSKSKKKESNADEEEKKHKKRSKSKKDKNKRRKHAESDTEDKMHVDETSKIIDVNEFDVPSKKSIEELVESKPSNSGCDSEEHVKQLVKEIGSSEEFERAKNQSPEVKIKLLNKSDEGSSSSSEDEPKSDKLDDSSSSSSRSSSSDKKKRRKKRKKRRKKRSHNNSSVSVSSSSTSSTSIKINEHNACDKKNVDDELDNNKSTSDIFSSCLQGVGDVFTSVEPLHPRHQEEKIETQQQKEVRTAQVDVSIPLPPNTPPPSLVPLINAPALSNVYSPSQLSSHDDSDIEQPLLPSSENTQTSVVQDEWDSSMSLQSLSDIKLINSPNTVLIPLCQIPMPVPLPLVKVEISEPIDVLSIPIPPAPPPVTQQRQATPPPSAPVKTTPSPTKIEFKPMSLKFKLNKVHPQFLTDRDSDENDSNLSLSTVFNKDDDCKLPESIQSENAKCTQSPIFSPLLPQPDLKQPQHEPHSDSIDPLPESDAETKSEISIVVKKEIRLSLFTDEPTERKQKAKKASPLDSRWGPPVKEEYVPSDPPTEPVEEIVGEKIPSLMSITPIISHLGSASPNSQMSMFMNPEPESNCPVAPQARQRSKSPKRLSDSSLNISRSPERSFFRNTDRKHSSPDRRDPTLESKSRQPDNQDRKFKGSENHDTKFTRSLSKENRERHERRDRSRTPEKSKMRRPRSPHDKVRSPKHRSPKPRSPRGRSPMGRLKSPKLRSPDRFRSPDPKPRMRPRSPDGQRFRSPESRPRMRDTSLDRMRGRSPMFQARSPGRRPRTPDRLITPERHRFRTPPRNLSPRSPDRPRMVSPRSPQRMLSPGFRPRSPPLERQRGRSPEFRPRTPPHRPRTPPGPMSPPDRRRAHHSPRRDSRWTKGRSPSPEFTHKPLSPGRRPRTPPPHQRSMSPRRSNYRSPPRRNVRDMRKPRSPSPRRRRRTSNSYSPPPPDYRRAKYDDSKSGPDHHSRWDKPTTSGETDMDLSSPCNSPLVGLKRSVADSTISDSELASTKPEDLEYAQGYYDKRYPQNSYFNTFDEPEEEEERSPRRLSLDERIDLELGVKKELLSAPQQIPVYQQSYPGYPTTQYYQYYQQEGTSSEQFEPNAAAYGFSKHGANRSLIQVQTKSDIPTNWDNPEAFIGNQSGGAAASSSSRVVQVGNVLQVVPTEDLQSGAAAQGPTPSPVQPITLIHPATNQVLQVGNILQVVPSTQHGIQSIIPMVPLPVPPAPPQASSPDAQKLAAQAAADAAEKKRLAKEKRKQEKEKRAERRKARLAQKLQEANKAWADVPSASSKMTTIVVQADVDDEEIRLLQEAMSEVPGEEKQKERVKAVRPSKLHKAAPERRRHHREPLKPISLPPVDKGILVSPGFREKPLEALLGGASAENKKSVTFADGIRPGEGTSPSGGEDMPSPPPPPRKLPKEKRFTKTLPSSETVSVASKKKEKVKKKKVKVKIVRQAAPPAPADEAEVEVDEDAPPPAPPPGSPPPYLKQYYQQFQAAFLPQNAAAYAALIASTEAAPPLPPPSQQPPPPPSPFAQPAPPGGMYIMSSPSQLAFPSAAFPAPSLIPIPLNPVSQIINVAKMVVEKNTVSKRPLLPTPNQEFIPPLSLLHGLSHPLPLHSHPHSREQMTPPYMENRRSSSKRKKKKKSRFSPAF